MEGMAPNLVRWFGFGLDDIVDLARTHPLGAIGENRLPDVGNPAELVWWTDSAVGPRVCAAQVGPWRIERGSS